MINNRTKERVGISAVSRIVETEWESGWQEYASRNDDAVDSIILMRNGRKPQADTGGVVFVQVECGGNEYRKDQDQYPDHLRVHLGAKYVETHMKGNQGNKGPGSNAELASSNCWRLRCNWL